MGIIDTQGRNQTMGMAVPYGARFGQFASKYEIPEGAVVMSKHQMQQLVYRTIAKWEPRSDMWSFKHGTGILAGASLMSGIYLNAELRSRFKLGRVGVLMTFGPTCLIPCATAVMVQFLLVQQQLVLRELDCAACAQIRSGLLLVANGVMQPALLAVLSCSLVARYRYTIKIPPINTREHWVFYSKMLRPLKVPLLTLAVLNFGVAMFVTEQQMKAVSKVHYRLNTGM